MEENKMEKITMHKYPYDWKDGLENIREYGFKASMKEDWYMTKDLTQREISCTAQKVLVRGLMVLAFPIILAQSWKIAFKKRK